MVRASIGVVTTVHTYTRFVEGWCRAVRGLRTVPDQVVLAVTDVTEVVPLLDLGTIPTTVIAVAEPFGMGTYLNAAIDACPTDWISWIGVDDRYRGSALDGIAFTEADVVAFGMTYGVGRDWLPRNVSAAEILTMNLNPIPCGSPFRRVLWERIGFQPDLAPFEDWAFWVGAAAQGARFAVTDRIDFDYAIHDAQIVPPTEPTRSRIAEWAANL